MIDLIFQNYFVQVDNPVYVIQSIPQILYSSSQGRVAHFFCGTTGDQLHEASVHITKVALISVYRT